ncbi:hypothetical protein BS47DRAFT_1483540 [Hydnum rufescens UP504]|uniref:Uncharacterized protein n=1 Tax=Hydnum rufescens UP504 TaxID=1448309 RepID=A0A9P6DW54_9AGAM|nr:hypothetical protein BS47DRAFT_1483540 [Hydnum rufescens UP504]
MHTKSSLGDCTLYANLFERESKGLVSVTPMGFLRSIMPMDWICQDDSYRFGADLALSGVRNNCDHRFYKVQCGLDGGQNKLKNSEEKQYGPEVEGATGDTDERPLPGFPYTTPKPVYSTWKTFEASEFASPAPSVMVRKTMDTTTTGDPWWEVPRSVIFTVCSNGSIGPDNASIASYDVHACKTSLG